MNELSGANGGSISHMKVRHGCAFPRDFLLYTDKHYLCTRRKGTTVVGRENEVNNEKPFHISKIGENPNANS